MRAFNTLFGMVSAAASCLALGVTGALAYQEAPDLAAQVAAGTLPPVEDRLPEDPLVVEATEVGTYGGEMQTELLGGSDRGYNWLNRVIGYEFLVRFAPEGGRVIPNVAESYEVSEDNSEFTFHLRRGLKWSDGEPVTADDYVFWYEDIALNEEVSPSGPGPHFTHNGEPAVLTKIDDYTIRYSFNAPYGLFLQQLASGGDAFPSVAPKHYGMQFHKKYNPDGIDALVAEAGLSSWVDLILQKVGGTTQTTDIATWANAERPSINAWVVSEAYDGSGNPVVAVRNPYYWKVDQEGNQLPYIDRVRAVVLTDTEVLKLMIMQGQLDFVYRPQNLGPNDKPVLAQNREQSGYHFVDLVADVSAAHIIILNLVAKDPVKREIFNQKDFRIALSHAINRDEIIDIVFAGQGEPYQSAVRPESRYYSEKMAKQYTEYDPEKANELLDGLGYTERDSEGYRLQPDGNRLSVRVDVRTTNTIQIDSLELIRNYWKDIGVELIINTMDSALYSERIHANEHEAASNVGAGGLNELLNARDYVPINDSSRGAVPWVYWFLGDPRGEEPPQRIKDQHDLYVQLQATADPDKQDELFRQILEMTTEDFRIIGTTLLKGGYGIVSDRLVNVPDPLLDSAIYPTPAPTNVSTWFIKN